MGICATRVAFVASLFVQFVAGCRSLSGLAPLKDYRPSCQNPAQRFSYPRRGSIGKYTLMYSLKGSVSMICCRSGSRREAGRQLGTIMKTRPTPAKYRTFERSKEDYTRIAPGKYDALKPML